ncbi:MAG TPA: hypothetical protein VM052_07585 [Candidatus Limnocylindrales bacterium]|nr:hypothetical protein [Candidatus Limnocylindrales bacterium]
MRRVLGLLVALLVTASCLGPKPQVRSAEVADPKEGKANVTVVIVNTGGGDGQVQVKITLKQGDEVVGRAEQTTELKTRERITLVIEVDVPEDAKDLEVESEVHYPPD